MSEDEVSDIQKLEMQYAELLKKKMSFIEKEVAAAEEAEKAKEEEEEQKKEEEEEEAKYMAFKERFVKEMNLDTRPAIDPMANSEKQPVNILRAKGTEALTAYREAFYKKHGIENPVAYGSDAFVAQMDGLEGYAFTDSDSGCADDVDAWTPADYYCDMIWHGKITYGYLSGKITVQGCQLKNGDGGVAQIRLISARNSATTLSMSQGCTCISCVSNTWSTYTATTDVIGDYAVICDIDEFRAGDVLKPSVIESMSRGIAHNIDWQIYNELLTVATPGQTVTLPQALDCDGGAATGSCCSVAGALFDNIIRLEALMRGGNYFDTEDPYLLIHPTIAAVLKYKDGIQSPPWFQSQMTVQDGVLTKIGSIRVIEFPMSEACTASSGVTIGIMIDPARAVSEIYGKKPFFKMDDDPIECLSTKIVAGVYVAIDDLDANAIGHIVTA